MIEPETVDPFSMSSWKCFECVDVARLFSDYPDSPISLVAVSILTHKEKDSKKKIIRQKYSISSTNLAIMGTWVF